jgi:hypothetical protein
MMRAYDIINAFNGNCVGLEPSQTSHHELLSYAARHKIGKLGDTLNVHRIDFKPSGNQLLVVGHNNDNDPTGSGPTRLFEEASYEVRTVATYTDVKLTNFLFDSAEFRKLFSNAFSTLALGRSQELVRLNIGKKDSPLLRIMSGEAKSGKSRTNLEMFVSNVQEGFSGAHADVSLYLAKNLYDGYVFLTTNHLAKPEEYMTMSILKGESTVGKRLAEAIAGTISAHKMLLAMVRLGHEEKTDLLLVRNTESHNR